MQSLTIIIGIITICSFILGFIIQIGCAGIYIGKLEGFKEFVNFRFDKQDKRLDEHNNFITRVYEVEKTQDIIKEKVSVANNRVSDLEEVNKR